MGAVDALAFLERLKPAWHSEAKCRGVGPSELYFEDMTWEQANRLVYITKTAFKRLNRRERDLLKRELEDIQKAKYCDGCPVSFECAEAGKYEQYGIWGGRSFIERFENMTSEEQWEYLRQDKEASQTK